MKVRTPILRITLAVTSVILLASCDKLGLGGDTNPTAPTAPPTPATPIVYSVIGASDAIGVGSSVPCLPFNDCPDGMGYVPAAVRQLKAQGYSVSLMNLGIPTAVISSGFQTLGRQYGRVITGNFIEQEVPFVLRNSTLVTIFAGANEINTITAALGAGAGGSDPVAYTESQVRAFGSDFATLLAGIRNRAGSPRIVAFNVPNLAGLPYLSGASAAQRQAAQRAAVGMTTTVVNPLMTQGVVVIDAMCDTRTYQRSNYSSDGLHPNDAGYAYLASEVVRAITLASYPTPRSSCPAMTMVQ